MLPSTAEYWHIGETTMRLSTFRSRRVRGWKRALAIGELRRD
jgi:hypothetical protein